MVIRIILLLAFAAICPGGTFVLKNHSAADFRVEGGGRVIGSVVWGGGVVDARGEGSDKGLFNGGPFFSEGDIRRVLPTMRNAVREERLLWPSAAVPYTIDEAIGCPDSWRCSLLMEAMSHLHEVSCVRFKEWTGESQKVHVFLNPERGACWSPVGRTGYASQEVSLGADCWHRGIILHELLHALGFWHEMNRPDRDDAIYVYWENILQGYSSAFYKQDELQVDTLGETFDYRSLMMYDEYAFSKDGVSETLRAKDPAVVIGPIWRKTALSNSDTRRLHALYSCHGNHDLPGFPANDLCSFDVDTCGFLNAAESSLWRWQKVDSKGFVYVDVDNWGWAPALLQSINFHAHNTGKEELGCLSFNHFTDADTSSLKVKVVYLSDVTEQLFDERLIQDLWQRSSNSSGWVYTNVPLYVHRPFKIFFEADFDQKASEGAVALDDVQLNYSPCPQNDLN